MWRAAARHRGRRSTTSQATRPAWRGSTTGPPTAAEKRAALNEWAGKLKVEIAKASGANITSLKQQKAKR